MNVQVVRQKLTHRGVFTRLVDGLRISGPEKQGVGLGAGFGVSAEECLHVPLQCPRQLGEGRPFAEPGQGEVDEKILAPSPGYRLPRLGVRNPLDRRERPLQRAESFDHRLSARKLDGIGQSAENGDGLHQGIKCLAGLFQPQFRDAPPRQDLLSPETIGQELLTPGFVLEQVESPDPGGDRLDLQLRSR